MELCLAVGTATPARPSSDVAARGQARPDDDSHVLPAPHETPAQVRLLLQHLSAPSFAMNQGWYYCQLDLPHGTTTRVFRAAPWPDAAARPAKMCTPDSGSAVDAAFTSGLVFLVRNF